MIKDILEKHKVYSVDLELDLLRHFEKLRNEMLVGVGGNGQLECNCSQHESGRSTNGWYCPVHGQMW